MFLGQRVSSFLFFGVLGVQVFLALLGFRVLKV